jgi:hypothetical protein
MQFDDHHLSIKELIGRWIERGAATSGRGCRSLQQEVTKLPEEVLNLSEEVLKLPKRCRSFRKRCRSSRKRCRSFRKGCRSFRKGCRSFQKRSLQPSAQIPLSVVESPDLLIALRAAVDSTRHRRYKTSTDKRAWRNKINWEKEEKGVEETVRKA